MQHLTLLLIGPPTWGILLILALLIFRVKIRTYYSQIIISSLIITLVSFLLQTYQLSYLVSAVQSIAYILCLKSMFKFSWTDSFLMTTFIYSFAMIEEFTFFLIASSFQLDALFHLAQSEYIGPAITLILLNAILSIAVYKCRFGFSILSNISSKISNKKAPIRSIILVMVLLFSSGLISIMVFVSGKFFVIATSVMSLLFIVLLEYLYFREIVGND